MKSTQLHTIVGSEKFNSMTKSDFFQNLFSKYGSCRKNLLLLEKLGGAPSWK